MNLTEFLLARIAEDEAGHMPDALAHPRVLAGVYADHPDYHEEWKP